jgi:hypothetical protein
VQVAHTYNLATWEAEIRRITVQGQSRQIVQETPISKTTRAKWTGGMAQAVEHLLCKHEALRRKKKKKPCVAVNLLLYS